MNKNKIQELFNSLISQYNLRAIKIEGEMWYALNDLPLNPITIRRTLQNLRNSLTTSSRNSNFEQENTKLITNSDVHSVNIRNFNTELNNRGEKFGNFEMINFLTMTSNRLGNEYKIELIKILKEIHENGFYIDNNLTDENVEKLKLRLKDAQIKMERITGKWYYLHDLHFDNGVTITVAEQEEIINEVWKNKNGEVKTSAHNKVLTKNGKLMISEIGIKQMKVNYINRAKQTQKQKSENII